VPTLRETLGITTPRGQAVNQSPDPVTLFHPIKVPGTIFLTPRHGPQVFTESVKELL
jgi:hypothetical protein